MAKRIVKARVVEADFSTGHLQVDYEYTNMDSAIKRAQERMKHSTEVYIEALHPKSYTVYKMTEKGKKQLKGLDWLMYEDRALESGIVEQLELPF